jgi:hypothetical protein
VDSPGALAPDELPEVILSHSRRLDPALVELLFFAASRESATGIIWGRTRRELTEQVLVSSAAARLNGPVKPRRTDLVLVPEAGDVQPDVQTIRAALTAGSGLLSVVAHGDGMYARLASRLVLCGMGSSKHEAHADLGPACVSTGKCVKVNATVADALREGRLFSPRDIAARVLLLVSCHAAPLDSPVLDSGWGFFAGLATNSKIGAVLATPENTTIVPTSVAADLAVPLAAGTGVGRALAEYERSATSHTLGNRFLLFGDPRTTAAPADKSELTVHQVKSHQYVPSARGPARAQLAAAEAELAVLQVLAHYVRSDMGESAVLTSRRAVDAIARYELEGEPDAGNEMRRRLLEHLATMKADTLKAWTNPGVWSRVASTRQCRRCGMKVRPHLVTFHSGYSRLVTTCMRCESIEDLPQSSRVEIAVALPRVAARYLPRSPRWAAAVFLVPETVAADTTSFFWPSASTGSPAPAMNIVTERWPHGPFGVRFVIVSDTALHVVSTPARAPAQCQ